MKKILLLSMLALGAVSANAQDITMTVQGKAVESGSTIDVECFEAKEITQGEGDAAFTFMEYTLNPEVEVTVKNAGTYKVTVTNTTDVGTEVELPGILFCWPSNCEPIEPGDDLTNDGTLAADTPTSLEIHSSAGYEGDTWLEEKFTLSCDIEVMMDGDTENNFAITINMKYDPSMNAVEAIGAEQEAPATYYDIAGRRILAPAQGQLVIERRGNKAMKRIIR